MIPSMQQVGKQAGINFSYGGKLGNTMKSHMLIEYAKQHGDDMTSPDRKIPLGATVSLIGLSNDKFNGLEGVVKDEDAETGRLQVHLLEGEKRIKVKAAKVRVLSNQKVDDLIEVLFRYYFEEEKDISDIAVLAACAAEAGLCSKEEMTSYLTAKTSFSKVKGEIQRAYTQGVSGVPHFFINNKSAFSGGQDADAWLKVFRQMGVY